MIHDAFLIFMCVKCAPCFLYVAALFPVNYVARFSSAARSVAQFRLRCVVAKFNPCDYLLDSLLFMTRTALCVVSVFR